MIESEGKGIVPPHIVERREKVEHEIRAYAATLRGRGKGLSPSQIEGAIERYSAQRRQQQAAWESFNV